MNNKDHIPYKGFLPSSEGLAKDPITQDPSEAETGVFDFNDAGNVPQSELLTADGVLDSSFGLGKGIPKRLGRYELAGELGGGGMGMVFDAYDPALKRHVALNHS